MYGSQAGVDRLPLACNAGIPIRGEQIAAAGEGEGLINRVGGGGNPPLLPLPKLFAHLKRQTPEMQARLPYICL